MTEVTDAAVEAAMAAAAETLAQPVELHPAGVYQAHECQTSCGRLADVIVVRIADSDVDIFCNVCHLMFMMAIANEIPTPEQVAEPSQPVDDQSSTETAPTTPE